VLLYHVCNTLCLFIYFVILFQNVICTKAPLLFAECPLQFAAVSPVERRGVACYHDCKFDFIDTALNLSVCAEQNVCITTHIT
jgi:hypothetical protein